MKDSALLESDTKGEVQIHAIGVFTQLGPGEQCKHPLLYVLRPFKCRVLLGHEASFSKSRTD